MDDHELTIEKIESELLQMLSNFVNLPKTTGSNSQLFRDLGLVGDDVGDFISAVEKQFDVSLEDFVAADYFPNEATAISDWPLKLLRMKSGLDPANYKPITLREFSEFVHRKF